MIIDLAGWRAGLTPDRPAVWDGGVWHSYADLNRRAIQLAACLHAAGVRKGDRVGILARNHMAHIDLMLAAPKLGFVFTPFNPGVGQPELLQLIASTTPRLLLADSGFTSVVDASATQMIGLGGYASWLAGAAPPPPPPPLLEDDDPWMILFTGGSTGIPKGAVIPYSQVFANAVNTSWAWEVSATDCAIQPTPLCHAGVNVLTTPLLYAGGRVVLMQSFDAGAYLRLVAEQRATLCFMVPTMYRLLAAHPDFASADLASLRWAISGGAPCDPALRGAYTGRGIEFKLGYGMTEAGVNCFAIDLAQARTRPDSVGRPMPLLKAIIRAADGSAVANGVTGELTLAGDAVFSGYFEQPEETQAALRDGWLWTGDLARQDEDGYFYIVGRRKDMYISGGENVYPAQIEAVLTAHPAVAECAVLGIPHPRWGESGLAAITCRAGKPADAQQLRSWLKQRLAGFQVPGEIVYFDSLPKTATGKIDKIQIKRLYARNREQQEAVCATSGG